ncbi:endonuclease/exonuclease/phosphatase family protein [Halorientalis sp.]|uniref:endonuclease/exonuclease/phosphatase family protein n=1 Tax=Halorientalis sp. TaxID=1931229 RepID=UPI0026056DDD|nr:endonuclease/exonuclease/phosphatase family protein [Halorientalis sp.]
MDSTEGDRSVGRRTVLGSIAGLTASAAATAGVSARSAPQSAPELAVLTRNVYLGVDLFALFDARSLDDVRRIAGELFDGIDPGLVTARVDAMAAEIEATQPDAVALQEAAAIRVQRPSDFGTDSPERAETVVVDLLAAVQSALSERGLNYEVAASTVTTDVELPADTDDGDVDVRLTDRDALLVRSDVDATATATATFEAAFGVPIPIPGLGDLSVQRGFCAADVTLGGETVTVASTHLSSVSESLRRQQVSELLAQLPTDRPVVVGGDFNSGPGGETAAYDQLTAELTDAYAESHPDRDGFTCCQGGDLRNANSRLDRRIDGLLFRGDVSVAATSRVGHRPEDRVRYDADGETVQVWPSDHAGVVGTFAVGASGSGATATATETAAPTGTPESTTRAGPDTTADAGPGLGVFAALAGIAGGLAGRCWRD